MRKNYGMELLWMMPKKGKLCKKKSNNIIENKRTKQKCNREKKYVLIMNSIDIIFGFNIHISYG